MQSMSTANRDILGQKQQPTKTSISEFEEKVQYIQQVFEHAWRNYPAERQFSQICYAVTDDGSIGSGNTQIETLLENFRDKIYKNPDQIQTHFHDLRNFWLQQCGIHKLNKKF